MSQRQASYHRYPTTAANAAGISQINSIEAATILSAADGTFLNPEG